MQIAVSEAQTKYHGQKVKTAVVNIPGKGRIELALSDTARCAKMIEAARNTLSNLGGKDMGKDLEANAVLLHEHCKLLMGVTERKPLR